MSHKKIKTISDPKLKLDILSKEDVQKIHEATLHIIENVGIRFPSKRALRIWEKPVQQLTMRRKSSRSNRI